MNRFWVMVLYVLLLLLAGSVGAQWVGYRSNNPVELGGWHVSQTVIYAPWSLFLWATSQRDSLSGVFSEGEAIAGGGVVMATFLVMLLRRGGSVPVQPVGAGRWAASSDLKAAGLLTGKGTVVGQWRTRFATRLLTYDGPEHQLVSGASRSGKGVGHVIPTLLNWPGSVLAYDVKGELWETTSGFRSTFSECLRFNPTRPDSARFNPLFEIRKGPDEVRDAQNVAEMLTNPTGAKPTLDIWDQQASQLLVALILHVLYSEPDDRKNLAVVRQRLLDFYRTCQAMASTNHRLNPQTHVPEPHPEVQLVARELLSQPEKFQASVRGTASSYLTLWADELVARNTAVSDFRLGDLMCEDRPVSIYLQPPPSDAPRLRPLVRLVINQACRALMETIDKDASGRLKRHRLLLMLDEFPTLGRLDFFTMNLRQMAGYGIKSHLIVQSFNDIVEAYGPHNTIIDNCHVLVAFASADTGTCQRVSQMTGTVTEYRASYSGSSGNWLSVGGRNPRGQNISHSEQIRPLLSAGEIREFSNNQQLIFVTGHKPIRADKLRYFTDPVLKARILPKPSVTRNAPKSSGIPWLGEKSKGALRASPSDAAVVPTSLPDSQTYPPEDDATDV